MCPDRKAQHAGPECGVQYSLIRKELLARKDSDDLGRDPNRWEQHDVDFGMAKEPEEMLPKDRVASAVRIEECGADVNARDGNGYSPLHHAASRGDNKLIKYLLEKGADVKLVSRKGQTTADMANGPTQRVPPFPDTLSLLVGLGAVNNMNCVSC